MTKPNQYRFPFTITGTKVVQASDEDSARVSFDGWLGGVLNGSAELLNDVDLEGSGKDPTDMGPVPDPTVSELETDGTLLIDGYQVEDEATPPNQNAGDAAIYSLNGVRYEVVEYNQNATNPPAGVKVAYPIT